MFLYLLLTKVLLSWPVLLVVVPRATIEIPSIKTVEEAGRALIEFLEVKTEHMPYSITALKGSTVKAAALFSCDAILHKTTQLLV